MKRSSLVLIASLMFSSLFSSPPELSRQSASLEVQGMRLNVTFYTPRIVRVFATPIDKPYEKQSLSVVKSPEEVAVKFETSEARISMESEALKVVLNKETGGIYFYDRATGKRLLIGKDFGTQFTPVVDAGKPSFTVRQGFALDAGEAIYGVGQVMDNKMNRRNSTHRMQNENMFTYSPYFMSVKGYAVFWDNYSISTFNDNRQELSFEGLGHCADYYFMVGGNADGVIANMRTLTGEVPMLPLWSYGFFQSKERYQTQSELLDVLKKYRTLRIPIDVMIQDWRYWPEYNKSDSAWNAQLFDAERYPDPVKWVEEIHKLNSKLLIVTWPGFGPKTDQRREFDSKNMIVNFDTWPPNSGARPYDVFNPEARNIYWSYLNKRIFSRIHNDGWWLDSTEPDHINKKESDYELPTYLGSYRSVKNAYSMMHNAGIATNQRATTSDKRVVILTRSGFIGQQRYGSNTWSGDVASTWDMLERQIPAALNFTLMGIPHWNSDIGGFFAGRWRNGGGTQHPEFQELYVRWMQFGAFSPMMRSHGTELPREIFQFGERGTWCFDAQERILKLRYRLLPYIYSTSWDVSANQGTFMRPMVMDFASDPQTHDLGHQYLFGRSLLVAPVTRYKARTWPVYLPEGSNWYDFWTNKYFTGGQTVEANAPADQLPVFVKAGAVLPWGPEVQYSTEKKWDALEMRVYPGADGRFVLYEDENDNYNYEKGMYSTIEFNWNEASRTLTIGDRKGNFPGMLKSRTFRVVLAGAANAVADTDAAKTIAVKYSGKKKTVVLKD